MDVHMLSNYAEILKFSNRIFKQEKNKKMSVASNLSASDTVRIKSKSSQAVFKKEYFIQNTREIFRISKVNIKHTPVTYSLESLDGEPIKGTFYRQELIPTIDPGIYDIKIIKQKNVGSRKKYLVEYINYPSCSKKWIAACDVVKNK